MTERRLSRSLLGPIVGILIKAFRAASQDVAECRTARNELTQRPCSRYADRVGMSMPRATYQSRFVSTCPHCRTTIEFAPGVYGTWISHSCKIDETPEVKVITDTKKLVRTSLALLFSKRYLDAMNSSIGWCLWRDPTF